MPPTRPAAGGQPPRLEASARPLDLAAMGAFCGMLVVAITGSWLLAAAVSTAATVGLVRLGARELRDWPLAIPMQPLDAVAKREALRLQPPGDAALLFVVCGGASAAWVRVHVDDAGIGHLQPGNGMVVQLRPGRREVSLRVGPPRLWRRETMQVGPGQVVRLRISASMARSLTIDVRHMAVGTEDQEPLTLLRPFVTVA